MKKLSSPLVLVLLGLLLGVGTSLAFFWQAAKPLIAAQKVMRAKGKPHPVVQPEPPWDFWTVELAQLSDELKDEKSALKKREDELSAREARFAAERAELEKQRRQIEAMRNEIAGRIIEISETEAKSLKGLATTYSAMTPKAMIPILREMDDTTVVKLFSQMKADVVSSVFQELGTQAATDPVLARRVAAISDKFRMLKAKE